LGHGGVVFFQHDVDDDPAGAGDLFAGLARIFALDCVGATHAVGVGAADQKTVGYP
jgi:hypothetical protein